jgi:hypothetical protein
MLKGKTNQKAAGDLHLKLLRYVYQSRGRKYANSFNEIILNAFGMHDAPEETADLSRMISRMKLKLYMSSIQTVTCIRNNATFLQTHVICKLNKVGESDIKH